MRTAALEMPSEIRDLDQHPRGLYVLFATEMWERFSFYSMLSMFTLYLRNAEQGFGWTTARATSLYSTYLACVYLSPLLGGWLADRKLGYRRSVMIGALFFMAGHLLLSFRSLPIMYGALACLVIGNGFFKPNVSAMVGMLLIGLSFYIMCLAGKAGGDDGKVSPWWLIMAYAVISLGELMVSPMGLSLVSKVAPVRARGLMMGCWFLSGAVGNKLTAIGVYWDVWRHSTFFAVLGSLAIGTGLLLVLLLKPLKRAMPGV